MLVDLRDDAGNVSKLNLSMLGSNGRSLGKEYREKISWDQHQTFIPTILREQPAERPPLASQGLLTELNLP